MALLRVLRVLRVLLAVQLLAPTLATSAIRRLQHMVLRALLVWMP